MSNTNDMTVGAPTRQIISFALPLVLGYLLQQFYNVADAAIVGQCVGVEALAAVGASSSIMFLVMGFCCGTCQGFAIPVAQAFGAKNLQLMRRYASQAVRISAVIAVVVTVVACLCCRWILQLINTPEAIMPEASLYLYLQFLLVPVAIAYNLLAAFIRALGNSRQPFYFLIFSSLLNILLDVLFVAVVRWGVAGAGVATILAQAWAAWLCWRYIRRELPVLGIAGAAESAGANGANGATEATEADGANGAHRPYGPHSAQWPHSTQWPQLPQPAITRKLLWNGLPMGLQFSITAIGSIMLQSSNNALGTDYVAAFTAAMRVKYVFTCVFENIGVAMATYCGQNRGAGRIDRVSRGLRSAMLITMVYFVFTLCVIYPLADEMMALFVDPSEQLIISEAARFMRLCNYFYPVLGLLTVLRYSIQGLGYAHLSLMSGVMEMLARTGVSLWIVPLLGFTGVIMGDPIAWLSADLFLVPCMLVLLAHLRRLHYLEKGGTL